MRKKLIQKLFLMSMISILLSSCFFSSNKIKVELAKLASNQASLVSLTTVKFVNNQLIIEGSNLSSTKKVQLLKSDISFDEEFVIESISNNQIVANSKKVVSFTIGAVFDLVLSSAEASSTFQVNFDLPDGVVTASKLASMGATSGQYLKYNGTTWVPSNLNAQTYLGTWNASTNSPDLTQSGYLNGDYYIVTTAGTYTINSVAVTFKTGDWVMYNGSLWEKIDNSSNMVSSFNGRKGSVLPASGDYTWSQITKTGSKLEDIANINITGRTDGQVLKWDATNNVWKVGSDDTAPAAGTITSTEIADGAITNAQISATAAIAQSKITGLVTDLAAKEPLITAGTTAQYYRGDKTFQTLNTTAVAEGTNLYFTNQRAIDALLSSLTITNSAIVAGDSIKTAIGKTQGQLNAIASGYVSKDGTNIITGSTSVQGVTARLTVPTPIITNLTDVTNVDYVQTAITSAITTNGVWNKNGTSLNYMSGYVGIGTTAPSDILTIAGNQTFTSGADRTISVATSTGDGNSLTLKAGDPAAYSDGSGGKIKIRGGNSDGQGVSRGGDVYIFGGFDSSANALNGNVILANNGSTSFGNVGIGTTSPSAKLEVSGGQAIGTFYDASSGAAIDFNNGNFQTTSVSAGTVTISNFKAGGSYTLILTNATGGTYTLSASGYTFRCQPACSSNQVVVNAGTHTVMTIIASGSVAYVSWMRGF
jgi:hypothetical protein